MAEGTHDLSGARGPVLRMGGIACHVVSDGHADYDVDFLFANVGADELSPDVRSRIDEQGHLASPYRSLLVETSEHLVLVDTGLGQLANVVGAPAGRLQASLERAGFSPSDIDMVVISHAHPDHIGGLSSNDQLAFPDARHVMSRKEWEFWTSEATLSQLPELLAAPARALLPPLSASGQLDLVEGERELVPGVRLVPAPGHTPGHCVVSIGSGDDAVVFLADALLDAAQLAHPDWVSAVDHDREATVATRRRLLDAAVEGGHHLLAYHMERGGKIESTSDGYRFRDIA